MLPEFARDKESGCRKNGNVICRSKRYGCDWRGIGGNADPGIYARTKTALRTRNSGSVCERPSARFFAAQRRSLERRTSWLARKARDAVRLGGDLPARGNKKLPYQDVRHAGGPGRPE